MHPLHQKSLPLAVSLACLSLFSGGSWANPGGLQVVVGQANVQRTTNSLTITNSPGAILNWQQFSIANGETTQFIQSSSSSAVLNRVTGSMPSRIDGTLSSNGRVFLVNPQGIVIGRDGVINTAGFIASTLSITDADWIAGKLRFSGAGETLQNFGSIYSPHGAVALIAPNVENHGLISAQGGQIMLAAGQDVTLSSLDNTGIHVRIQAPTNRALNLGQLLADDGAIGILAGTLKVDGVVQARRMSLDGQGQIVLAAQENMDLASTARIDTSSSVNGATGSIKISTRDGTSWVAGQLDASNSLGQGGQITVTGHRVGLADTAVLNATGRTGGGTILLGGDYRGENPMVANADQTYLAPGSRVDASATHNGNGGRVIAWSESGTQAYGSISAKGGVQGGNGGFVETSGRHGLALGALPPDVSAPAGKGGLWLLDPDNLTITSITPYDWTGTGTSTTPFQPLTGYDGFLNVSTLTTALAVQDVYVYALNTLTTDAAISWASNFVLNLQAGSAIHINQPITASAAPAALHLIGGNITQTAGISVPTLHTKSSNGSILLNRADNFVGKFSAYAPAGNIEFSTSTYLTLVASPHAPSYSIYAPNQSVRLNVIEDAAITQEQKIKAQKLDVSLSGSGLYVEDITLTLANEVQELSGNIGGTPPYFPRRFSFTNNGDLTLVDQGSGSAIGINLAGYSYDPSNPAGVIALTSLNGSITQAAPLAGAAVMAKAPNGNILLNSANITGIIAGSAGGAFEYRSSNPILVSEGPDTDYMDVPTNHKGIQANRIRLESAGNVIMQQSMIAGATGEIKIKAGGNVIFDASSASSNISISAPEIHVQGNQVAMLGSTSRVDLAASKSMSLFGNVFDFSGLIATGLGTPQLHIARNDGGAMSIGGICANITACTPGQLLPTSIYSGASLIFGNHDSLAGPTTTSLMISSDTTWNGSGFLGFAATGNILQNSGTQITANKLGAISQSGSISLANAINQITSATLNAANGLALQNSTANLILKANNTGSGNIAVQNAGDLSISNANSVLNSAGAVMLSTTGQMTIDGFVSGNTIDLTAADVIQNGNIGDSSGKTTTVTVTATTGNIIMGPAALTQVNGNAANPSITYNATNGSITALLSQFIGAIPHLNGTPPISFNGQPLQTFATSTIISGTNLDSTANSSDTQTEEELAELQQVSTNQESPIGTTTQRGFPQCAI